MDGVHDLGGRQGFGPIDTNETEESFHTPWDGRMWGMARAMTKPPGWTIDWFRHSRELIDPADYLTRSYFDQWMQTYAAMLVDSGAFSVAELAAAADAPAAERTLSGRRLDPAAMDKGRGFDREIAEAPKFAIGEPVRTKDLGRAGHTRLPGYARGRVGAIDHSYGAHVFADASAEGRERAEPLYSVKFAADTLWPEAAGRREWVYVDLWESYLDSL